MEKGLYESFLYELFFFFHYLFKIFGSEIFWVSLYLYQLSNFPYSPGRRICMYTHIRIYAYT